MARQIPKCFPASNRQATEAERLQVLAQDRFAEPARSAVNAQIDCIGSNSKLLACFWTRDALNRLQLSKVISAANRAKTVLVSPWPNATLAEKLPSIAVPGAIEISQTVR